MQSLSKKGAWHTAWLRLLQLRGSSTRTKQNVESSMSKTLNYPSSLQHYVRCDWKVGIGRSARHLLPPFYQYEATETHETRHKGHEDIERVVCRHLTDITHVGRVIFVIGKSEVKLLCRPVAVLLTPLTYCSKWGFQRPMTERLLSR